MTKFVSSWLLYSVVLILYSVPQSFLAWLLWELTIGVYFLLLWVLGTSVQMFLFCFSPVSHLCAPLWHFAFFSVGLCLDSFVGSSAGSGCRRQSSSFPLSVLPCSIGVFNETYSLRVWMTPFLLCVDRGDGGIYNVTSITCRRVDHVSRGLTFLLFRACGSIPCGWVSELLFILVYILAGGFFFIRSIFRIWCFRFGFLCRPLEKSVPAVFLADWDSVSVLTSDQLSLHAHWADFSPGQQTVIVDNCANTHVWNDKSHCFVGVCSHTEF